MAYSSTSFRPKWRSGKTTVIRVPDVLSEHVLEYAQILDSQPEVLAEQRQKYMPGFEQLGALPIDRTLPINVSKSIHRSPFRYPGGKTWFVSYLKQWLRSFAIKPDHFIEPFAGGAICALSVAFEGWARHTLFAELDPRVASVWQTVLGGQAQWLAEKIENFELSGDNVRGELERESRGALLSLRERAFLIILRNRVQRGGIMAPGAGLVKSGENGRGLKSRWYPETLARRIREIDEIKDRLTFEAVDGMSLIERFKNDEQVVFFLDPPYTKAARRLYDHWEFDHQALFASLQSVRGHFLLTYDNTPEIRALAKKYGYSTAEIAMKNTHHEKMTELLIGSDLSWLDLET